MPSSAVEAGVVDFIMPPAAISKKLIEIKDQITISDEDLQKLPQPSEDVFKQILSIVDEVRNELKELIDEKKAVIECGQLGDAKVNRFQFRQVINNLLGNALKFTRPGIKSHIIISGRTGGGLEFEKENFILATAYAGKLSPRKKYYKLSISDNGIGFDTQYKERIFDAFQRLHGNEEYTGTGIGLYIVKKIIENHDGTITANGEVNHGASLYLYPGV